MVTHPPPQDITINVPRDPNTLSNYNNFVTKHTIANFEINFEKRVLEGNVKLSLESITEGEINRIILDTRCVLDTTVTRTV